MALNFPDAPADGAVFQNWIWSAATGAWLPYSTGGGSGGASITISDTPPASPTAGALWWESDTGTLYVYYNDGNSSQWVQVLAGTTVAALPSYTLSNVSFTVSAAANALTIALKTASGADPSAANPINVSFRSTTPGTPDLTTLTITAPLSFVISAGSTLGVTAAAQGFRLWIVLFNDAGTPRLGVINCSPVTTYGTTPIDEDRLTSSVAEGGAGAADSGHLYYTGVAVSAKAIRIIGYVEWNASGLAAAGNWTTTNLYYAQVMGPGVKRPGDVLQVAGFSGQQLNTVSTTFVDVTGASVGLAMRSAANKVTYSVAGQVQATAGGAGVNSNILSQLLMDAAVIGTGNTGVVSGAGTNFQTDGATAMSGVALPNVIGTVTFKYQHRCLTASHNVSSTVRGMFQEIMG